MTAAQMLKMAGFPNTEKGRKDFYDKFPDEQSFKAKYGKQMAMGGQTNKVAFPQQPDADEFYSEGFRPSVSFGFYETGGLTDQKAFPQQPTANKFFSEGFKPSVPFGFYKEGGLTDEIAFPPQPTSDYFYARYPYTPSYNYGGMPIAQDGASLINYDDINMVDKESPLSEDQINRLVQMYLEKFDDVRTSPNYASMDAQQMLNEDLQNNLSQENYNNVINRAGNVDYFDTKNYQDGGTQYGGNVNMDAPYTMKYGGVKKTKKLPNKKVGGSTINSQSTDPSSYTDNRFKEFMQKIQEYSYPVLQQEADEESDQMVSNLGFPTPGANYPDTSQPGYAQYGMATGYNNPYDIDSEQGVQPLNEQNILNRTLLQDQINNLKQKRLGSKDAFYGNLAREASDLIDYFKKAPKGLGQSDNEETEKIDYSSEAKYGALVKAGDGVQWDEETKKKFDAYLEEYLAKKYSQNPYYNNPYYNDYYNAYYNQQPYNYPVYSSGHSPYYKIKFEGGKKMAPLYANLLRGVGNNMFNTEIYDIDTQFRRGPAGWFSKVPKSVRIKLRTRPRDFGSLTPQSDSTTDGSTSNTVTPSNTTSDKSTSTTTTSPSGTSPSGSTSLYTPSVGFTPTGSASQSIPGVRTLPPAYYDPRKEAVGSAMSDTSPLSDIQKRYSKNPIANPYGVGNPMTGFSGNQLVKYDVPPQETIPNVNSYPDLERMVKEQINLQSGIPGNYDYLNKNMGPEKNLDAIYPIPSQRYGGIPKAQVGTNYYDNKGGGNYGDFSYLDFFNQDLPEKELKVDPYQYKFSLNKPFKPLVDPITGKVNKENMLGQKDFTLGKQTNGMDYIKEQREKQKKSGLNMFKDKGEEWAINIKPKKRFNTQGLGELGIAGMDFAAGLINRPQEIKQEKELLERTGADYVFAALPANGMSRGDRGTVGQSEGMLEPNKYTYAQSTVKYGGQYADGGMYDEDNIYELTDEEIAQIIANGGEIEYLD